MQNKGVLADANADSAALRRAFDEAVLSYKNNSAGDVESLVDAYLTYKQFLDGLRPVVQAFDAGKETVWYEGKEWDHEQLVTSIKEAVDVFLQACVTYKKGEEV